MKKNIGKNFNQIAAQGELLIIKTNKKPTKLKKVKEENGKFIVGHSETGHHHTIDASKATMYDTENPLLSYLEISGVEVPLLHERSFDTHEPLMLSKGTYEVRRQREFSPEGWRLVQD